jgi:3-oxoacyl-[acyl-carrier-protein] synthase II
LAVLLPKPEGGLRPIGLFPTEGLPLHHGAEARDFTGEIGNFGVLETEVKKAIRKGSKVMCRESQMAVAAAQRALHDCGLSAADRVPERFGCVFGSDYMLTLPEDFTAGVANCRRADGSFDFDSWATDGMPLLNPLWLLKYLPNMPASHIAIYNDLRGPSNSLTLREASGHLAVGEAAVTIKRGAADIMVVGATGTRVHPMKTVHAIQSEQVALGDDDPAGRGINVKRHGIPQAAHERGGLFILASETHHCLADEREDFVLRPERDVTHVGQRHGVERVSGGRIEP